MKRPDGSLRVFVCTCVLLMLFGVPEAALGQKPANPGKGKGNDGSQSAPAADPVVTSASVTGIPGDLTVNGSGFGTGVPTVVLGTVALAPTVNADGTQITAALPAGLTPGTYQLTIGRTSSPAGSVSFAVAIGAIGPAGPQGADGATGPEGPPGPAADVTALATLVTSLQETIGALQAQAASLSSRLAALEPPPPPPPPADIVLAIGYSADWGATIGQVFKTADGATAGSFPIGPDIWHYVAVAGGRVFAAYYDSNITMLDTTTGAALGTVDTGSATEGIVSNTAGTTVYAINIANGVSVIDAATGGVIRTVPIANATEITYLSDTRVFVLAHQAPVNQGVFEIDPTTGTITNQWSTSYATSIAASANYVVLQSADGNDQLQVLNLSNGALVTIGGGGNNGTYVFAGSSPSTFNVVGFDWLLETGPLLKVMTLDAPSAMLSAPIATLPTGVHAAAGAPDGSHVFLGTHDGQVLKVNMASGGISTVASLNALALAAGRGH